MLKFHSSRACKVKNLELRRTRGAAYLHVKINLRPQVHAYLRFKIAWKKIKIKYPGVRRKPLKRFIL